MLLNQLSWLILLDSFLINHINRIFDFLLILNLNIFVYNLYKLWKFLSIPLLQRLIVSVQITYMSSKHHTLSICKVFSISLTFEIRMIWKRLRFRNREKIIIFQRIITLDSLCNWSELFFQRIRVLIFGFRFSVRLV